MIIIIEETIDYYFVTENEEYIKVMDRYSQMSKIDIRITKNEKEGKKYFGSISKNGDIRAKGII